MENDPVNEAIPEDIPMAKGGTKGSGSGGTKSGGGGAKGGGGGAKGGGGRPPNAPSTTGKPSGGGRGNNPPK